MSRDYTMLQCGCFVSCDGGGGLIQGCCDGKYCNVQEYFKEHSEWCDGYCKICHLIEYKERKEMRRRNGTI